MNINISQFLLLAGLTAVAFGVLNAIVDRLEEDGTIRGYRAVFVGIGVVLLTLASLPIAPLEILAQQVALAVVATIIMIAGEIRRQRKIIKERQAHWEAEAKHLGGEDAY